MIVRKQMGGDRRFRRELISFFISGSAMPYRMNDNSSEQICKLRCILDPSNIVHLAFKDESGAKQIKISDRDRLYLKIKKMKIMGTDENLYSGLWLQTGLNSEPRSHYLILVLLCVKGIFKNGDLELPIVSLGVAIENDRSAKIMIPDRVYEVYDNYKTGGMGDFSINSEKTAKLDLNAFENIIKMSEFLHHHSHMDLNSYEEYGMTVDKSENFANYIFDILTTHNGSSFEESLGRKKSSLSDLLSQEYEYFKENIPIAYKRPCEIQVQGEQTLPSPTPSPTPPPTPSPTPSDQENFSPLSQTSSRTEVGYPSSVNPIEECLRDNPCLKLIYDELKGDELKGENKGAIKKKTKRKKRKKRKKSLKNKKRRTKRLSKKKQSKRKRSKKQPIKRKTRNRTR